MPIHRAFVFVCGTCQTTATHYSSAFAITRREAEQEAHYTAGWQELYGDWRCPDCAPKEKRERRRAARQKTPVVAQEVTA